MIVDGFKLGLVVGLLSFTTLYLLVFSIVELVRVSRQRNYRPRYTRSTYKPLPRRRAKHRADV